MNLLTNVLVILKQILGLKKDCPKDTESNAKLKDPSSVAQDVLDRASTRKSIGARLLGRRK